MPKKHIPSWPKVSYEDSEVLPYDTSAGRVPSLPNTTKVQVPEKKQRKSGLFWNCHIPTQSTVLELRIPFTVRHYIHVPLHLHLSSFGNLPAVPLPWQVFPHAIDPLKVVQTSLATGNVHQEPRKKLLSSLEFCTNHHTEILPEFLPVSFPWDGAYSWNYSEPLGREQGSGQPFQGSFKSYFLRNQCHCYNC